MMWFIRLFIVLIAFELIYMLIFQESTRLVRHGESYTIALEYHPIRFVLLFIMFAVFEAVLIRVHRDIAREERGNRKRRGRRGGRKGSRA